MFARVSAGLGLCAGSWLIFDVEARDNSLRASQTIVCALRVARRYREYRSDPKALGAKAAFNEVVGSELLALCRTHGGAYTKFGQHLSTQNHALPKEITGPLSQLQDQLLVANRGLEGREQQQVLAPDVRRLVENDLLGGAPLESEFDVFDSIPIGSASLAAVYRARRKPRRKRDAEWVAVKVQHPHLQRQLRGDFATLRLVASVGALAFPELSAFDWILTEFEDAIRLELDFEEEGRRSERTAQLFARKRERQLQRAQSGWLNRLSLWADPVVNSIHVPVVHWNLSSNRVLTMELIEGVKVNDHAKLEENGWDPAKVASALAAAWSEMVFGAGDGFVHCDCHPGNVMVRAAQTDAKRSGSNGNNFELVILDHGCYRKLDAAFRKTYAHLWHSIVLGNDRGVHECVRQLKLGDNLQEPSQMPNVSQGGVATTGVATAEGATAALLSYALTRTTWRHWNWNKNRPQMTKADRARIRALVRSRSAEEWSELLQGAPRDLLFALRVNNQLRSIEQDLVGHGNATARLVTLQRFQVLAECALRKLHQTDTDSCTHDEQTEANGDVLDNSYMYSYMFHAELLQLRLRFALARFAVYW